MKLLVLDTAMAACSVAVVDTDRAAPLAARWQAMERGHAEAIAPMVEAAMAEAGLAFAALDGIAITTGPGTFTGVRIGLAMARGLGLALNRPVLGIDTLTAIAANVTGDGPVLVAADARNGEVYTALFDRDRRLASPPAIRPRSEAASGCAPGTLVIGTAADAVIAASSSHDLVRCADGDLPVAARIARLAASLTTPSAMPVPLYLRAPDAKPQAPPPARHPHGGIELCAVSDPALLAALHAQCFETAWTAADFASLLAMPGTMALAATQAGEPMAFALFRRAAGEVEVITIGTRPAARRRGLAHAILERHFTEEIARGAIAAFIEVAVSNMAARALYGAMGFVPAGHRKNYYHPKGGVPEDAIVMRKELRP